MIPPRFEVDCQRELLQELSEDTPLTIMDKALDVFVQPWSEVIQGCADLAVPNTSTFESSMCHQAFMAAGAMACIAFQSADVAKDLRVKTLRHLRLASIPVIVFDQDNPMSGMEIIAREGRDSHPEFKDHTDFVVEYYAATTQDPEIAKFALCGAGVMLYQLDQAWSKARNLQIEKLSREMTVGVDWDNLPWDT